MAVELLASWWAWIVTATLQASVLLGAVGLVDRLTRRAAWPQVLSCLWWLALARLVLPLDVSSPWSVTQRVGTTAVEAARMTPHANALAALAILWAFGAALVVLARVLRRRRLARSVQIVQPSPAWRAALEHARQRTRSRRALRVAALPGLSGAALFGVLRPTLLLPPSALLREPTAADEHALVHELMHLRRGDLWKDELVALARALFWFNPLVWQAASRLHQLSELACDRATAAALGEQAQDYRTTLLAASREWITRGVASPTELRAFLGSRALLLARLEQLDRAATTPALAVRSASALLTAFVAACVLPMAPSAPTLREQALAVFAAEQRGELRSCFQLQAAARVLAADSQASPHSP
ncbi:MAG: M56 family metallopeptidase [Planctomycetes bacterium]|nr:M56 family metallopeptidase [Planctomycetota bacterium]